MIPISSKLFTGIVRFVIGYVIFKFAYPDLISLGLSSATASTLLIGVLVGLGIWSYRFLP